MIQGVGDSTSNFLALFQAIVHNAVVLASRVNVPFLHRSFYSLYLQIFLWTVGIMIFKYFFEIGLDSDHHFALGWKHRISEKRRYDGIIHYDDD